MRNLEDCKAEVFRRSEERIKERKRKRNRVLVCCIPLCLLLVVGGFWLKPLLQPMDEIEKINAGPTPVPDRELGGLPESELIGGVTVASVEITDKTGAAEVSFRVTDAENVEALGGFVAMFFDIPTGKESVSDGQDRDTIIDEYELRTKYGLDEMLADYKFVFRGTTGETLKLRLYRNYLYNEDNGCVVVLSDTQLTTLTAQLEQAKGERINK